MKLLDSFKLSVKFSFERYASSLFAATTLFFGLFSGSAFGYGVIGNLATRHIDAGDTIQLHQSITAPGGEKVYIQNGKVKNYTSVNQNKPFCYFHVYRSRSVIDNEFSLNQDSFRVTAVNRRHKTAAFTEVPVKLAAGASFNRGASQRIILTKIQLKSDHQPDVSSLNCGIWAVPTERNHLSIKEVKSAFGKVISVEN